jgi:hypothetical protein
MARLSKISSHARTAGNYCNASMWAFTESMLRYPPNPWIKGE